MKTIVYCFLLLQLFLFENVQCKMGYSIRVVQDKKILKNFHTVGFFSSCFGLNSRSLNEIHINARESQKEIPKVLTYWNNRNFQAYDVCNNTDYLVELITDMFLNEKYFLINGEVSKEQNIIFVLAYVTQEMSILIERIIGTLHPTIARLCLPHNCDHRYPNFKLQEYTLQIADFLTRFEMYDVTFINIVDNNGGSRYEAYYNATYNHLKETEKFCLRRLTFNMSIDSKTRSFKNYDKLLQQQIIPYISSPEAQNSVVLFFGETSISTHQLANRVIYNEDIKQIMDRILIFQDIQLYNGIFGDNKNIIDMYFTGRQELFYTNPRKYAYFEHHISYILYRVTWHLQNAYTDDLIGVLENVYQQSLQSLSDYILEMISYPIDQPTHNKGWQQLSEAYLKYANFSKVQCKRDTCQPGYHFKYGAVEETESDESHSMRCELCPINTIKLGLGDGPCVPCTGEWNIDNGKRTACIDPYTEHPTVFDDVQLYVTLVAACSGCTVTAFILILFAVKHNTPVVLLSDKWLSIVHLSTLLFVFLAVLWFYTISYLEVEACIGRNLMYSVVYTLHVGCLYTKSQKLLKAFTSKTRLTASEINSTYLIQMFTILILLIITNGCLVVVYFKIKPEIDFQKEDYTMIRYRQCNTLPHQNIQILLLTAFQFVCSIQAYRCRNLPYVMNEAMSLFYAILITSVSFGISFPISYFRRQQRDKEFLGVSILMINCFVTIILLYAKKCYIMLLRPKHNTKNHFHKMRMQHNGL